MLRFNAQWAATLLLPLIVFCIQKWFVRQHQPGLSHDGANQNRGRLGSLDDLNISSDNPDTTAVILNWSRFPNVQRISSLLCSTALSGVISEVFIWNNSPQKLSYDDFVDTTCPTHKLKIHNSAENLYFRARFLACAQANTPYCFIQDDDYLVFPEVIRAMHARMHQIQGPHTLHLLPAHEHLSSSLREIHVGNTVPGKQIHTGFAWLGHGALLHRSEAVDFVSLMHALNASDTELQMADNYYTVLKNRVPEIWFDQGVELGGGQPFTVGADGDERNNRHIRRAMNFLQSVISNDDAPPAVQLPYVHVYGSGDVPDDNQAPIATATAVRAVCRHARCLLETNIASLPGSYRDSPGSDGVIDMLQLEARKRDTISAAASRLYLDHPPSKAVDNRQESYFESSAAAQVGDYIQLDFFADVGALKPAPLEMVWLVSRDTEQMLRSSRISSLRRGLTQCVFEPEPICIDGRAHGAEDLRECVFPLHWNGGLDQCELGNVVRLEVVRPVEPPVPWRVHEVWVR